MYSQNEIDYLAGDWVRFLKLRDRLNSNVEASLTLSLSESTLVKLLHKRGWTPTTRTTVPDAIKRTLKLTDAQYLAGPPREVPGGER